MNRRHGGPARWTGRPALGATCDSGRAPLQNGPRVPFPADAPADAPPADEPEAAARAELAVEQPALSGHWAETRGGRGRRLHSLLRPLSARSLLRSRLLSRAIGLRLGSLWLRSPSALRLSTLDGRTVLAGRRWRLGGLLTLRASGRRSRLLTLLALTRGSGRLRMPTRSASRSPSLRRLTAGGRSWRVLAEPARPAPDTCSVHCG